MVRGDLDQRLIRGIPTLNEVAFFHRKTRTLLLTDLCFNFAECDHWPTRIFLRLMGGLGEFGCPRHVRWSIRDRQAARSSLDQVLNWGTDRIVVAHGVVLQHSGTRSLRESFDWL